MLDVAVLCSLRCPFLAPTGGNAPRHPSKSGPQHFPTAKFTPRIWKPGTTEVVAGAPSCLGSNQDSPDPEASRRGNLSGQLWGIGHFPSVGARFPAVVCPLGSRRNYGKTTAGRVMRMAARYGHLS